MKLYLVKQDAARGYDTYDSMIVAAESEEEARRTHPNDSYLWNEEYHCFGRYYLDGWHEYGGRTWATKLNDIKVQYIGEAIPDIAKGVLVASFNAG